MIGCLGICSCKNQSEGQYFASYADAVAADIISTGMAPSFMPTSSYNIYYLLEIEKPNVLLRFQCIADDLDKKIDRNADIILLNKDPRIPLSGVPNWFKDNKKYKLKYYKCPGDFGRKGVLAVDHKEQVAFYWLYSK